MFVSNVRGWHDTQKLGKWISESHCEKHQTETYLLVAHITVLVFMTIKRNFLLCKNSFYDNKRQLILWMFFYEWNFAINNVKWIKQLFEKKSNKDQWKRQLALILVRRKCDWGFFVQLVKYHVRSINLTFERKVARRTIIT